MTYDIDTFVNTNKSNIQYDEYSDEVQATTDFEKLVNFDEINSQAYPVLVYVKNNNAVAWYDTEMFAGYIS